MRIIGIDPGGTTGITVLAKDVRGNWVVADMRESQSLSALSQLLEMMGTNNRIETYFVMESAVPHGKITKGKMLQMFAIGAVMSAVPYRLEAVTPEERSRIKKVPKRFKGVSDHIKDAYRTAVAYGLKKGLMSQDDADNLSSAN